MIEKLMTITLENDKTICAKGAKKTAICWCTVAVSSLLHTLTKPIGLLLDQYSVYGAEIPRIELTDNAFKNGFVYLGDQPFAK